MTATVETRKRSREDDGSGDSSMPLSKRINNLHINSNSYNGNVNHEHHNIVLNGHHQNHIHQQQQQQQHYQYHHQHPQYDMVTQGNFSMNGDVDADDDVNICDSNSQHQQFQENNHHQHHQQNVANHHNHSHDDDDITFEDYNPELNRNDNPYYYEKNKLLYELHTERIRRSNQP